MVIKLRRKATNENVIVRKTVYNDVSFCRIVTFTICCNKHGAGIVFLSRCGKPRVRALAGLKIGNLKGLFLGKDLQKVRHVFSDEEYELNTLQKLKKNRCMEGNPDRVPWLTKNFTDYKLDDTYVMKCKEST